jgi:hypothetical protein
MAKRVNIWALAWGVPGLLIQGYGILEAAAVWGIAGTVLLLVALLPYVSAKGHHPAWALWGLVPLVGPLVLILQRPQRRGSPQAALDNILLEEDPHIRPFTRPPATVHGGWLVLLVLAPLGVLIVLFSPFAPRVEAPGIATAPAPAVSHAPEPSTPPPAPPEPAPAPIPEQETEPSKAPEESAPAPAAKTEETPAKSPTATSPAPKTEKASGPAKGSVYVARFKQLQKGMTYEQVCAIIGDNSMLVSGTLGGDKIVKWKNPDQSFFAARFHNNLLERTSNLNFPPPEKELKEMAAELARPEEKAASIETKTAAEKGEQAPETIAESKEGASQRVEPESPEEEAPAIQSEPGEAQAGAPERKSVVRVGESTKPPPRVHKARLPRFTQDIDRGPHDVHLYNTRSAEVKVGLRAPGKRGKDLTIPPHGMATVFLPNNEYTVYYIDPEDPETLQGGRSFIVNSPPDAILIKIR